MEDPRRLACCCHVAIPVLGVAPSWTLGRRSPLGQPAGAGLAGQPLAGSIATAAFCQDRGAALVSPCGGDSVNLSGPGMPPARLQHTHQRASPMPRARLWFKGLLGPAHPREARDQMRLGTGVSQGVE